MDIFIIFIAKYFIVIPIIAAIFVAWRFKNRKDILKFILVVLVGGILSLILAKVASMLWYNPRPFVVGNFTPLIPHAADNGFPSDHVLLASFLGWTILRYSKKIGIGVLVVAAIIGISRVMAGVHHPIDVIGSFVVSGLVVGLMVLAEYLIKRRIGQVKT
ncbi:MAG TPA: phosphatase PAP2 family protein [Candidatus Saccharibacteria bacterium]|nr:phosphatase PAP2 family protein [Candidatus Saccharibacteria bacterium]HRQ06596.1 phosphatase PAP2 family protein [Candidatus Saccharibacteria bacterium]